MLKMALGSVQIGVHPVKSLKYKIKRWKRQPETSKVKRNGDRRISKGVRKSKGRILEFPKTGAGQTIIWSANNMDLRNLADANAALDNMRQNMAMKALAKEILCEENYERSLTAGSI